MKKLPFGDKTYYLVEEQEIKPLLEDIKKKEEEDAKRAKAEQEKNERERQLRAPFSLNGERIRLHVPLPYYTCSNWYSFLNRHMGIFYKGVPITIGEIHDVIKFTEYRLPNRDSDYYRLKGEFDHVDLLSSQVRFDGQVVEGKLLEEMKYLWKVYWDNHERIAGLIRCNENFQKSFGSEYSLLNWFALESESKRR